MSVFRCAQSADTIGTVQVARYDVLELSFDAKVNVANPFTTYLLKVKLTAPDNQVYVIDGFFDGDGKGGDSGKIWKARIAPYMPGLWRWEVVPGDVTDNYLVGRKGTFKCVDSGAPGGVVASGKFFSLQNGRPIYLQGNFLDKSEGLVSTHVYMSHMVSDSMRNKILDRQLKQKVNKINLYIANRGDYGGRQVWPWLGKDQMRMDLQWWADFDRYLQEFKLAGLLAELWFFADDSKFGELDQVLKNQLSRYTMARTSAFSHTLYVIALEWQEGWSMASLRASGNFIQKHNPWQRLVSVHSTSPRRFDNLRSLMRGLYEKLFRSMDYSREPWADFIASQAGNKSTPQRVNSLAI